jgi:hypothetical protein
MNKSIEAKKKKSVSSSGSLERQGYLKPNATTMDDHELSLDGKKKNMKII